ncbi:hypothetical protein L596_013477 [Steinernema carpocapsae]|uniref:Autophagy-related protein n=1 Tax=Steinernema carpocapsae TaxID=34508 RepID=A0A4U5P0X9_STECR|nr:hypothetical protein L596_013477 [Steinernema carpocapsae]
MSSSGETLSLTKPIDSLPFKEQYTFERRQQMSQKEKQKKHPDGSVFVLVVCERSAASKLPPLPKNRYKVDENTTIAKFMVSIRDRLTLKEDESLFFFVNDTIPASMTTFGELQSKFLNEDGFLYVQYQEESVYGC